MFLKGIVIFRIQSFEWYGGAPHRKICQGSWMVHHVSQILFIGSFICSPDISGTTFWTGGEMIASQDLHLRWSSYKQVKYMSKHGESVWFMWTSDFFSPLESFLVKRSMDICHTVWTRNFRWQINASSSGPSMLDMLIYYFHTYIYFSRLYRIFCPCKSDSNLGLEHGVMTRRRPHCAHPLLYTGPLHWSLWNPPGVATCRREDHAQHLTWEPIMATGEG